MGYDIYNNICLRYFDSVYIMLYSRMYKMDHSDIYHKNKTAIGGVSAKSTKEGLERTPPNGILFLMELFTNFKSII